MSERASASCPWICSGLMYWIVPTTALAAVRGLASLAVGAAERSGAAPEPAVPPTFSGFARPKSVSFAPLLVSQSQTIMWTNA
jgi:hypothetical protein